MTKLTEMCATARRNVAISHRASAAVAQAELDKLTGFTAKSVKCQARIVFHKAQAKLWDAAAAHAEQTGFVSVAG